MPIDRPDPADYPGEPGRHHPPGGPRSPDAGPPAPPGPADRAAAHRAYQAIVDQVNAAYQANAGDTTRDTTLDTTGDTWAEAVPSLRASWREHEERHPERERATPRTRADGSWSSGESRRLTPDQNTEATKACADIHEEGERAILPAMRQIEAADPTRHLAGLEHMLKGTDRLKEKIADMLLMDPQLTPRQALDKIPDAVRYAFVYPPDRYADGIRADIERLKAAGFEEVRLKNLWSNDQYKGINSQWRRPETRLRFEVQFHTPQSLAAKELTHGAYERLRRPEAETTQAERDELEDFQHRVNTLLATPPGAGEIRDFPEGKR